MIAAKPELPVLILSPSDKTLPGFNFKKSLSPVGIISTKPVTFVATAILLPYNENDNKIA